MCVYADTLYDSRFKFPVLFLRLQSNINAIFLLLETLYSSEAQGRRAVVYPSLIFPVNLRKKRSMTRAGNGDHYWLKIYQENKTLLQELYFKPPSLILYIFSSYKQHIGK